MNGEEVSMHETSETAKVHIHHITEWNARDRILVVLELAAELESAANADSGLVDGFKAYSIADCINRVLLESPAFLEANSKAILEIAGIPELS
jgi:hypothetical protein